MKLYGIPNCNTVKKARQWLADHQVNVSFHDFRRDGINDTLLRGWLAQAPWEKLVNRASMTWHNLPDEVKTAIMDDASAIELMLEKPSVIKRPLLENDGKILYYGFDDAAYQKIFCS